MSSASSSRMAGTRNPATPRSRASSSARSRSSAGSDWRWQWESIGPVASWLNLASLRSFGGAPRISPRLKKLKVGRCQSLREARWSHGYRLARSLDAGAVGDRLSGVKEDRLAVLRGGEDHPLRLDAHQLRRLQVRYHDDLLAHQLLRPVLLGEAGDHGAGLLAEVQSQLQELVGLRYQLRGGDRRHLELGLEEAVDRDHRFLRCGCRFDLGGVGRRAQVGRLVDARED